MAVSLAAYVTIRNVQLENSRHEQRIARALGQSGLSPAECYEYVRKSTSNPESVLKLLRHPDPTVKDYGAVWARGRLRFDDAQLHEITTLIPSSPTPRKANLLEALAWNEDKGAEHLANLIDESPALLDFLNTQRVSVPHQPRLCDHLARIAADGSLPIDIRTAAVETWGLGQVHPSSCRQNFQELAQRQPELLGRSVRIAFARQDHDSSNIELLSQVLDEPAEFGTSYAIVDALREAAALGDKARTLGPKILPHLRPLTSDVGTYAAVTLGAIGYQDAVPHLVSALRIQNDWRLAGAAAEGLGRLQAEQAKDALVETSVTHWNSVVRRQAKEALEAIVGQREYPASRGPWAPDVMKIGFATPEWQPADRTKWDRFREEQVAPILQWMAMRWTRAVAPKTDVVEFRGELAGWNLLPRSHLFFERGLLLGYDEGEFGAGVVFVRRGQTARLYPVPNVTKLLRWSDRAAIFTNMWSHDGILFVASRTSNDEIDVTPFFQLPHGMSDGYVDPEGALVIDDHVRIWPDGRVEALHPTT